MAGQIRNKGSTNWYNALRVGIEVRESDESAAAVTSVAGERLEFRRKEGRSIGFSRGLVDADSLARYGAPDAHCAPRAFARH